MFSIFGKRKPAETPTDDQPIQGPAEATRPGTSGDDFVFIERKPGPDAPHLGVPTGSMYPPMPPAGYLPYPPMPGPRSDQDNTRSSWHPGLATKDRYTSTQMQVDSILALLTRQLSVDELAEEYTFALERSVQNECY
ncbi:GD16197 [Drosophila simulans]|uniref:GD16197 n=1 Tax=Drosophila simulans TaxID=7240 RepID=B4R5F2_DROSI|nr:GD16197 [Drosophila simulans]